MQGDVRWAGAPIVQVAHLRWGQLYLSTRLRYFPCGHICICTTHCGSSLTPILSSIQSPRECSPSPDQSGPCLVSTLQGHSRAADKQHLHPACPNHHHTRYPSSLGTGPPYDPDTGHFNSPASEANLHWHNGKPSSTLSASLVFTHQHPLVSSFLSPLPHLLHLLSPLLHLKCCCSAKHCLRSLLMLSSLWQSSCTLRTF